MKKTTSITLLMLMIFGLQLYAAPISMTKALEIATSMISSQAITRQSSVPLQCIYAPGQATRSADFEAAYYVFGQPDSSGFIIISGDDELTPLIGYSNQTLFDAENMPDALKALLNDYTLYVAAIQGGEIISTKVASRTSTGVVVEPLITTTWSQDTPFNNLCPTLSGSKPPTGCVATAMAQVMKYYNWPAASNATLSDQLTDYGYAFQGFTIDHPLKWKDMIDSYDSRWNPNSQSYQPLYSETQAEAVANLMVQCGISVNMGYNLKGSGAFTFRVANALRKYFKYSPNVTYYSRANYLAAEWVALIRSNLTQKMPVVYAGNGSGGGHAFVCDGIDAQDLLHINWGWGGYCDGYFDMAYMNPDGVGIDGRNGFYNHGHEIIGNIKPLSEDEEEMTEIPDILTIQDFRIVSDKVISRDKTDEAFLLTIGGVHNLTDQKSRKRYYFGLVIANQDGDILYKSVYNIDFASGSYTKPINFYMDPTSSFVDNETKKSWPNGEYQILPMMMKGQYDDYKNISELQPLESNGGMSSVKLTITDTEFTLTPDKEIPLPDLHFNKATSMSKLFIGSSDEIITFTIENKSPTTYSGEVIFYFVHEKYNETETDIMSQPYFSVNASIYGSREVDVYAQRPYLNEAGIYKLYVYYKTSSEKYELMPGSATPTITVYDAPSTPVVKMNAPLDISYNQADRKDIFIIVSAYLQANSTYNGPLALYALKAGDTQDKEVLLIEKTVQVSTSARWVQDFYDYATKLLELQNGTYNCYLKYQLDGEMVVIDPSYYNLCTIVLGEAEKDHPKLMSALIYNDGKSVMPGEWFKIKATLIAENGFTGQLSGNSLYYDNSEWKTVAYLKNKNINLQPNEQMEVEMEGYCHENVSDGTYELAIYYIKDNVKYALSMGEHASSAKFEVVSPTGIQESDAERIYAVPQSDGCTLKGLSGNEDISLFDLNGRLIYQLHNVDSEVFIPIAGSGNETFLVLIKNNKQKTVLKVMLP